MKKLKAYCRNNAAEVAVLAAVVVAVYICIL